MSKLKIQTEKYDEKQIDSMLSKSKNRIRFGLVCINNYLTNQGKISPFGTKVTDKKLWLKEKIYNNRTCIRKTFTIEKVKELGLKNVLDIVPILEWNEKYGIKHFRLSSDMFPHYTDDETESYSLDFVKEHLAKAGEVANKYGHRITMHPGQYNQIGANSEKVFEKTCHDLKMHADILDLMNIDDNGILCIHGGGVYGDKESTKRRWIEQFDDLPSNVKKRLAIENCEKCYSTRDCLDLSNACKIPVIMDSHHYCCYEYYNSTEVQESPYDLIEEVIESWKDRIPLVHVSDSREPEGQYFTAHHDYVQSIPDYFLSVPEIFDKDIHIEIEAKAKEAAVFKMMLKYNSLFEDEKIKNIITLKSYYFDSDFS